MNVFFIGLGVGISGRSIKEPTRGIFNKKLSLSQFFDRQTKVGIRRRLVLFENPSLCLYDFPRYVIMPNTQLSTTQ